MIPLLLFLHGAHADDTFTLGSYGRVQVGTTPDGHGGAPVTVALPTRLVKSPYLELDLAWARTTQDGARFDAVVTPALVGALFHYDGQFDGDLALRNLYASARDALAPDTEVWAGSRMVRGDDVFLLDTWPLDNLNLVGGGATWTPGASGVRLAAGLNRLAGDAWQVQDVEQVTPGGVGTTRVTVLDRQRAVLAATTDHTVTFGGLSLRPRVHLEAHALPAGTRRVNDGAVPQDLPADSGRLFGVEASAWGWAPDSHAHVFVRRATGLAATGLLNVPTDGLAPDRTVRAAREDALGVSLNHEAQRFGVALGVILRDWNDADGASVDPDDGGDLSLAVRPAVKLGRHANVAVELAREQAWRDGVDPRSGLQETATITRLSVLPALQATQGTFGRPQVRLQYTASLLDDATRRRFAAEDPRVADPVQHWVGIGAEWWIASRSYR
jgi:maltoporin